MSLENSETNILRKATQYIAMLYVFIMPIVEQVALVGSLLGLCWLVSAIVTKFKYVKVNFATILFSLLYLLHVFSLFYTNNSEAGLFDIQLKFGLFVFPFALIADNILDSKRLQLLKFFVTGCLLSGLLSLVVANYNWFSHGQNTFFYNTFPLVLHPSYLSMYMSFAILILLGGFFNEEYLLISGKKVFNIFSICLLIFFQLLLSSKLGWITTLVEIFIFSIVYIVKYKKWWTGHIILTFLIAIPQLCYHFSLPVKQRVDSLMTALTTTSDGKNSESSAIRIAVWKVASDLVKENWTEGVGAGDVKDELLKKYKEEGIDGAYQVDEMGKIQRVLNAHNEFLQIFLGTGIIGFILLLIYFIWPLMLSSREKNWIYFGFLLIVMANFMVESMLETQAGVLFYGFFNSLLFKNYSKSV